MADPQSPSIPASKTAARKIDWSKYIESSARENVRINFEAGVYDRGHGDLDADLAALPLA